MKFDAAIIGGGITGAGLARDCAMRGLKTILLEQALPGQATTRASSHLIHGGLRYLLYDRLTTHTTAWDAGNIIRVSPQLVSRLPILWPVYRGHAHGIETVETLLEEYDSFQRMKGGLPHLRLSAEDTASIVPGLKREGLIGSISFDEWWIDAVALVQKNLAAAADYGAEIRTRCKAAELIRKEDGAVRGVRFESDSGEGTIEADCTINAAGPWADRIAKLSGAELPLRLRKGSHLVYDRPLTPVGLLLEADGGDRYVFVLPHPHGTLVGPTDLGHAGGPELLQTDASEISYLLSSVRRYLPDFPGNYSSTTVGARPILGQTGSEKLLSREYRVIDHESEDGIPGFVTIGGGKMSDYRLMAKDTVDLVCKKLGRPEICTTDKIALDGNPLPPFEDFPRPWRPLKKFLRNHPRLRELHALGHLGAALSKHTARRCLAMTQLADPAGFRSHYGLPPVS